jgi:hypothetical protein
MNVNAETRERFSWQMLKPYTVGLFCEGLFRYAYNRSKVQNVESKKWRSGNKLIEYLIGI